MPGIGFFRALGLFVVADFLDPALCARIAAEVSLNASQVGRIGGAGRDGSRVDETIRKVLGSTIPESMRQGIDDHLSRLTPQLENHFQMSLGACDGPHFLRYGPGAFYKPHHDVASTAAPNAPPRAVSVVLFLNDRADSPAPTCYGGGSLTFHGLLADEPWQRCAFPLDASAGMLVAFRANVLHEVEPVTFGERCTMVAWLCEAPDRKAS